MSGGNGGELREISHGDHCCLFFNSVEQQAQLTAPFLGIGLERDERCVFIGDGAAVEAVRESLRDAGISVDREAAQGRLVLSSEQDYLEDGRWRTEKMLGFLQHAYDSALADGFTALRATGDISWQVGPHQEFAEVVYYEALLDMFFIGKRMVGMCQYPNAACPAETLSGILQAHKVAVIDSEVCSNYHYMPPELLVEQDGKARERKRVDWMTSQLLRIKKAEAERDAIQEQLLHAQKLELVGKLAGSIAHDFNNVLTCVISFSKFALESAPVGGETWSDIKEIEAAGERGAALSRQLLAFGRRQVPQPRVLHLNQVISAMEKLLNRIFGKNIVLELDLAAELGPVKADRGQIEQVITNLAFNARDAMPDSGTFTLATTNVELDEQDAACYPGASPGPYVMLTASDTGCGMDQQTQSRIFEPFFTTKDASRGTGLGLSTIHGIVKQSGGVIAVDSELGKGTVFRIGFPRLESPAEAVSAQPVGGDSTKASQTTLGGTETILIIEDDDTVQQLVQRMLINHGYTVLATKRPSDAVALCETHQGKGPIHLMITDVLLPWTSEHELMRRVQTLYPEIKVLFIPGYADREIAEPALLQAEWAVVEKPFSPDAMLREVRKLLDSSPPVGNPEIQ